MNSGQWSGTKKEKGGGKEYISHWTSEVVQTPEEGKREPGEMKCQKTQFYMREGGKSLPPPRTDSTSEVGKGEKKRENTLTGVQKKEGHSGLCSGTPDIDPATELQSREKRETRITNASLTV